MIKEQTFHKIKFFLKKERNREGISGKSSERRLTLKQIANTVVIGIAMQLNSPRLLQILGQAVDVPFVLETNNEVVAVRD